MATSGTFNFSDNTQAAQIIVEAFERLGIFGEQVSGDMLSSGLHSFNYMLTSWTGDESKQWAMTSLKEHVCVPGEASFSLDNGEYDILDMVYRENNIDIGMSQISRSEYLLINAKYIQSSPVQYFLDKSQYPPVIYLYPVPNSALLSLIYTVVKLPEDISDPSYLAAVTPWWIEAMTAGVTARLATKFKPEMAQDKMVIADIEYRRASRADLDQTNCRIRSPYKFG